MTNTNLEKLVAEINRRSNIRDSVYRKTLTAFEGKDITFLEIGACDGVFPVDVLYPHAYTNKNWKGVMVEPVPYYFEKLKENYDHRDNIQFINAAISDTDGEIDMFIIPPEVIDSGVVPRHAMGVSRVDGSTFKPNVSGHAVKITVDSITLDTLIERTNLTHIDVLQIDVEGLDYELFKGVIDRGFRPALATVEYHNLPKAQRDGVMEIAKELNYEVHMVGADYILINLDFLKSR